MQPVFESVSPELAISIIDYLGITDGTHLGFGFIEMPGGNWKFLIPKSQEADPTSCEAYIVYVNADYDLLLKVECDIFDEKNPHAWSAYMFDHPEFGSKADYDLSHEYDPPLRDEPEAVSFSM